MNPAATLVVGPDDDGQRLDAFIAKSLGGPPVEPSAPAGPPAGVAPVTRSQAQRLIRGGRVTVDGKAATRPSERVRPGQRLVVARPPQQTTTARPERIPLDVVYEDHQLIVVNKQRGLVVHPAPGHPTGTLVNALLYACPELQGDPDPLRPGIVHRLDRDTTGLLVAAKDPVTREGLSRLIQDRRLQRTYVALVHGAMGKPAGRIEGNIGRSPRDRKRMAVLAEGGRPALTLWRRLASYPGLDLLEVKLHTGRTHQIRVHLAHAGHPVAWDPVYGRRRRSRPPAVLAGLGEIEGQALHAWKLAFDHPRTGQPLSLTAPLPTDFAAVLARLCAAAGQRPPAGLLADEPDSC